MWLQLGEKADGALYGSEPTGRDSTNPMKVRVRTYADINLRARSFERMPDQMGMDRFHTME